MNPIQFIPHRERYHPNILMKMPPKPKEISLNITFENIVSKIVEKAIPLPNKNIKIRPVRIYRGRESKIAGCQKRLQNLGVDINELSKAKIYSKGRSEKEKAFKISKQAAYRRKKQIPERRNCRKELEAMGMNTDRLTTKKITYLANKERLRALLRDCRKELEAAGMNTDRLTSNRIYYLANQEKGKQESRDYRLKKKEEKTKIDFDSTQIIPFEALPDNTIGNFSMDDCLEESLDIAETSENMKTFRLL